MVLDSIKGWDMLLKRPEISADGFSGPPGNLKRSRIEANHKGNTNAFRDMPEYVRGSVCFGLPNDPPGQEVGPGKSRAGTVVS